jgi:uncharacterized phage protein (TIGR02218 family)
MAPQALNNGFSALGFSIGHLRLTTSSDTIRFDGDTQVFVGNTITRVDSITNQEGSQLSSLTLYGTLSDSGVSALDLELLPGLSARIDLIQRLITSNPQLHTLFIGQVGAVTNNGGFTYSIEIVASAYLADKASTDTLSVSCNRTFGDRICGVDSISTSDILSVLNQSTFTCLWPATLNASQAVFGSVMPGYSSDFARRIAIFEASIVGSVATLQLIQPPITPLVVGQKVTIFGGCDHSFATCKNLYNNLPNFQGAAHLPTTAQRLRGI